MEYGVWSMEIFEAAILVHPKITVGNQILGSIGLWLKTVCEFAFWARCLFGTCDGIRLYLRISEFFQIR